MARLLCLRTASAILAPPLWAVSSAVEHYLDMVGVTGSIPVLPTRYRSGAGNRPVAKSVQRSIALASVALLHAHQAVERIDLRFVALYVFGEHD